MDLIVNTVDKRFDTLRSNSMKQKRESFLIVEGCQAPFPVRTALSCKGASRSR